MDTVSRREEDNLLKSTKARALKECDDVVRGEYRAFCALKPKPKPYVPCHSIRGMRYREAGIRRLGL